MRIFGTGPDRLVDLADVNPAALANGYAPVWNLATSKFTMQPVVTGGGVSLSDITAGTLQVPLNMVGSSSLTSTNVQIIGNNTNDLLLHVPDTGSIGFAEAGNVRLRYQYYASPGAGFAPASYLYNNTSGAGNNTDKLILAGGTPDPSIGTSVGTFSYVAVYGYDAEFTYGAYGSVHYGTATVGASVANAKHYFHGYNDTGGFPSATIAPSGIEIYKLNQAYAVLLRANNITAARTFDFPDTSGTLMVSGGSGSVSISNLTAGTMAVALTLGNALTVTAANRELIGTSSGVQLNTPTGTTIVSSVNGTAVETLSSTLDTMAVPVRWSTNVALTSTDYAIGKHSTTQLALNAATGGSVGMLIAASEVGKFTSAGLDLSTNSKQVVFGAGGTATTTRSITGTSTGLSIDTPSSSSIVLRVNGTSVGSFSATLVDLGDTSLTTTNNFLRVGAAGTTNMTLNAGSSTSVVIQVGGTAKATISASQQIFGDTSATAGNNYMSVGLSGTSNMTLNAGSSASGFLQQNGNVKLTWGNAGLTITDAVDFIFSGTTGTKLGGASAKLSLYGATPIVRPATGGSASTFVANAGTAVNDASTFDGYTLGQVVKALRNLGALT